MVILSKQKPFGGFHSHGGTRIAGWFIVEHPNLKWIMTGGTPISGNAHLSMDGLKGKSSPETIDFVMKISILGGPKGIYSSVTIHKQLEARHLMGYREVIIYSTWCG